MIFMKPNFNTDKEGDTKLKKAKPAWTWVLVKKVISWFDFAL